MLSRNVSRVFVAVPKICHTAPPPRLDVNVESRTLMCESTSAHARERVFEASAFVREKKLEKRTCTDDTTRSSDVVMKETRLDDCRAPEQKPDCGTPDGLQPRERAVVDGQGRDSDVQCAGQTRARVAQGAPGELDAGLVRVDHSSGTLDFWRVRRP